MISQWAELWEFWALVSIFLVTLALVLWFHFSPAIVRFNDFQRDIEETDSE